MLFHIREVAQLHAQVLKCKGADLFCIKCKLASKCEVYLCMPTFLCLVTAFNWQFRWLHMESYETGYSPLKPNFLVFFRGTGWVTATRHAFPWAPSREESHWRAESAGNLGTSRSRALLLWSSGSATRTAAPQSPTCRRVPSFLNPGS